MFKALVVISGVTQRKRAGARDQAGSCGHGPAGDHQGDIHHAAMRQPLRRQVLWQLLQEHRPMGKIITLGEPRLDTGQ
jgi:hypothetical protein